MSVLVNEIVAQFGNVYINEGQNMERLKAAIRQKAVTPSVCVPLIVESDVYRSANAKLGEIVQQFQSQFTAKGDFELKPNEIPLRNIKVDVLIDPDKVKASWLGFLANDAQMDRTQWPLVRYILEVYLAAQIQHDLEMKTYFKGVYTTPTSGVAGGASKALDGFRRLINLGLANGTINPLTLATSPTTSNIFDSVEKIADAVLAHNTALEGEPINICMAPSWVRAYFRDKRNVHGTNVNYSTTGINEIDFIPNMRIVGLPSMEGSDYIMVTPSSNMVHLRKVNGMASPDVQKADRQVKVLLDWWEGIGFLHNELVYACKPADSE